MKNDSLAKKILLAVGERVEAILKLGAIIIFDPYKLVKARGSPIYLGPSTFVSKAV